MYLFELKFSIDICLGLGLRDNLVALFLVFQGTSILFSIVAISVSLLKIFIVLRTLNMRCIFVTVF